MRCPKPFPSWIVTASEKAIFEKLPRLGFLLTELGDVAYRRVRDNPKDRQGAAAFLAFGKYCKLPLSLRIGPFAVFRQAAYWRAERLIEPEIEMYLRSWLDPLNLSRLDEALEIDREIREIDLHALSVEHSADVAS